MSHEQNRGSAWHNVDINKEVLCGYTACCLIENVIKKSRGHRPRLFNLQTTGITRSLFRPASRAAVC